MTFYLKYRPKTLEDLDLTTVREALKKIIVAKDTPHALLFSGPKGLGKTSAARILAKAINCENPGKGGEPCNKCDHCSAIDIGTHLDVIELDAASNRGIDDIRILRDAVKLAPASASKKIYIIDEAHMLTTEASNALLKTLEEPPSHVIFILATTNPEKLIDTVRSRTTNIVFKKPSEEETLRSLKRVVKAENMKLSESELKKITNDAGGSFRDAIKILESIARGDMNFDSSVDISNLASEYVDSLVSSDLKKSLAAVSKAREENIDSSDFTKKILEILRSKLFEAVEVGENQQKENLVDLTRYVIKSWQELVNSPLEYLPLEVISIAWCKEDLGATISKKKAEKPQATPIVTEEEPEEPPKNIKVEKVAETSTNIDTTSKPIEVENQVWNKILDSSKGKNKSLESLLRTSKPISFDGDNLTLGVFYSFHKERLEANPHRQMLDTILNGVFGKNIRVSCVVTKLPERAVETVKAQEGVVLTETSAASQTLTKEAGADIIQMAKDIFGN